MKKTITTIILLTSFTAIAQEMVEVIQFPQSFKLDTNLVPEYQLLPFDEEMQQMGFKENPGIIADKDLMKKILNSYVYIPDIDAVYYEFHTRKDELTAGIGLQVFNFSNEGARKHYVADQYAQSNYALLTFHDNYLIELWCDDGRNGETTLKNMIAFYEVKLGAELEELQKSDSDQMGVEPALQEAEDAVDTAAEAVDAGVPEVEDTVIEAASDTTEEAIVWDPPMEKSQPVKDIIGEKPVAALHKISRKMWSEYELNKLETYNPDFTYAMYDELITNGYIVWLVERYGRDEQIHWAVLFDTDGNYKEFKRIAYENSEGSVRNYAAITGDKIRIYKESIYDNDAVQTFEDFIMTSEGFKR